MTGLQLALSAITPLASAAVAGIVAVLVARRSPRSNRKNGVLDKRYAAYERLLNAAAPITSGRDWDDAVDAATSDRVHAELIRRLNDLELIAPAQNCRLANDEMTARSRPKAAPT